MAGVAFAVERDGVGVTTESYAASALYTTLASLSGALWRIKTASSMTILGYRPEEMIGHSAVDFIHPDDLESTRAEMRAARRGLQMRNFETRYVHKDGQAVTLTWMGTWSE